MRHELSGGVIVRAAIVTAGIVMAGVSMQAAEAVVVPDVKLVVRTYTHTGSARDIQAARRIASAILERADVRVEWLECGLQAPADAADHVAPIGTAGDGEADPQVGPDACARPRQSNELVVRVVPLGPAGGRHHGGSLGFAFIDLQAGGGWLATVYPDRVERLATAAGADRAELLGRAIAHEIGHLLLGTNDHGTAGLMRASWSGADLRRNRAAEWVFHREEGEAMRRRIATAGVGKQKVESME